MVEHVENSGCEINLIGSTTTKNSVSNNGAFNSNSNNITSHPTNMKALTMVATVHVYAAPAMKTITLVTARNYQKTQIAKLTPRIQRYMQISIHAPHSTEIAVGASCIL